MNKDRAFYHSLTHTACDVCGNTENQGRVEVTMTWPHLWGNDEAPPTILVCLPCIQAMSDAVLDRLTAAGVISCGTTD